MADLGVCTVYRRCTMYTKICNIIHVKIANMEEESKNFSWTKPKVIELIEMLQGAPSLWDIGATNYKNRSKKYDDLANLAQHFNTNVEEISKKLKSLKTQFSRERKKIESKKKNGAQAIPEDCIWFGYDMMKFLMEKNVTLGSRSTIEEIAIEQSNDDDETTSNCSNEGSELESPFAKPVVATNTKKTTIKRKKNDDERVDEAYKFMRSVQQNMSSKDDFTVYGENVASRMRSANKTPVAISIVKNHIDNILFQFEMDLLPATTYYSQLSRAGSSTHSHSPSPPFMSNQSATSNTQSDSSMQSPPEFNINSMNVQL